MPDLRRNWFHVLVALAKRDAHGSGIARDVKKQTDGALTLWPATLYRTLDDMTTAGLIVELTGAQHPEGQSAKRRYYRVTEDGKRALSEAARQMSDWAGLAERRLGGS